MKILHAAALLRPPMGVVNQMIWEQQAANMLGAQWDARVFCPSGSAADSEVVHCPPDFLAVNGASPVAKMRAWVRLRRDYHRWLLQVQHNYDALLLRYYVHDPFQLRFVRRASKPVYFVHHTLEGPELAVEGGVVGWGRTWAENRLGGRTIRLARGIVCVTSEIARYETGRSKAASAPVFIYPNGIVYSGKTAEDKRADIPKILFIASSFAAWHGLDRLLDSVRRFREPFLLHLVGSVGAKERIVAEQDPRIVLHGRLSHEAISQLAASCDVGLSSFALDRKQMAEACALKVREYLMLGLPVYAGYREVLPENFPYYRRGPADIEMIAQFARELRTVSRSTVSEAARPYTDKQALLAGLIAEIKRDSGTWLT